MKAFQFFALASLIMAAPHKEKPEAMIAWVVFGVLAVGIYMMERVDGRKGAMSTELKPCPFCGVRPSPYDGAFVVAHTSDCIFTNRYDQEMWLVGSDDLKLWNRRATNGPSASPDESKEGKEADRIVVAAIVIWAVGLLVGFAAGYMVGRGNGKMEAYEAIERRLAIDRQSHHGAR